MEENYCSSCNGSGEGIADGIRCTTCKGKGYLLDDDDMIEPMDPPDDPPNDWEP